MELNVIFRIDQFTVIRLSSRGAIILKRVILTILNQYDHRNINLIEAFEYFLKLCLYSIFRVAVTKFNDHLLIKHAMTQSGHSSLCPDSDYYFFFRFEKKKKNPLSQINIYYRKITFVQNFNHLYVFSYVYENS